jgi:hypothetical protein
LCLRGKMKERSGEDYVTWSFTISTLNKFIRLIKSKRMKWAECVAHMGDRRAV